MERCRCSHHPVDGANHRVTRRTALRAAATLAATMLTASRLSQETTAAQDATPPADLPDLRDVPPLPLTGERLATFETFISTMVADLGVPGTAVAVVQDDGVAFLQGFGVRETGQPEPVTGDTLLRIGSVTKSFSSLLSATLVDAGQVTWDTPLIDLLPDFAVADAALTQQLTLRDAFCACTGLPRRDLEFQFPAHELSPELIVQRLAELPLTAPFGETFQYNNQLVATGGYAAAVADAGDPDDLAHAYAIALRDRVLNPIGMPRTTLALADVVAGNDYAVPHSSTLAGEPAPLSVQLDDAWIAPVAPTGALWSSAREMTRYLLTELGLGVSPQGVRVVSAENLTATWQPGVPLDRNPATPPILANAFSHYALGWETGDYGGLQLISHTGGTYGFNSLVAFMPTARLGLVVLTNRDGAGGKLAYTVLFRLLEILFAQPESIAALVMNAVSAEAATRGDLLRHLGEVDAAAVTPFLGRYSQPALGELTLSLRDGALVFDAGGARSALLPRLDDAGAVIDYVFVDPPWASNPPVMHVSLTDDGGVPQVVLTATADAGAPDLVYHYQPLATEVEATPASS